MNPDEAADVADQREELAAWLQQRTAQNADFEFALNKVEQSGCKRLHIGWLLSALAAGREWESISRDETRKIAEGLDQASKDIRKLFFSQLNRTLRLDSLRLAGAVKELANRVEQIAPQVHVRRPMNRDLCRATLIAYVREKTGEFNDDAIAALIQLAESEPKVGDVFAPEQADEPVDYTTEAHIQWRNRDSCQALLDGPSQDVVDLLKDMRTDLGGEE